MRIVIPTDLASSERVEESPDYGEILKDGEIWDSANSGGMFRLLRRRGSLNMTSKNIWIGVVDFVLRIFSVFSLFG